jgi:hypothetical protein
MTFLPILITSSLSFFLSFSTAGCPLRLFLVLVPSLSWLIESYIMLDRSAAKWLLIARAVSSPSVPQARSRKSHRRSVRKAASSFEFSLCLSRACLGKMIVCIYKWLKNAVFRRLPHLAGCEKQVSLFAMPF